MQCQSCNLHGWIVLKFELRPVLNTLERTPGIQPVNPAPALSAFLAHARPIHSWEGEQRRLSDEEFSVLGFVEHVAADLIDHSQRDAVFDETLRGQTFLAPANKIMRLEPPIEADASHLPSLLPSIGT